MKFKYFFLIIFQYSCKNVSSKVVYNRSEKEWDFGMEDICQENM